MKLLQRYYFYVGIPVLLVLLGAVVFYPQIMGTVEGNPHPQINYAIFVLIVFGCGQMLMHVRRINQEGALLQSFFDHLVTKRDPANAALLLKRDRSKQRFDVSEVLQLLLGLNNQVVGPLQHAVVEAELARFQARQGRRLLLSQFMAGMMVGLGLLGTFIGLLGALSEIGKLIGSFTMGAGMADPVAAISELVTRLTAPMQAMGVAFSASLFGVLGSLIMGMLMVSVRSASGDLVSVLQSRVSLVIDAISVDASDDDLTSLNRALSELAQHSPILQGLTIALDQSERRVRQVTEAVSQLVAVVDVNSRGNAQVVDLLKQSTLTQSNTLRAVEKVHEEFAKMVTIQNNIGDHIDQFMGSMTQHETHIEDLLKDSNTLRDSVHQHHMASLNLQQGIWQEQSTSMRTQLDSQLKYWDEVLRQNKDSFEMERKAVREQSLAEQQHWREQMERHETTLEELRQQSLIQSQEERSLWQEQMLRREQELSSLMSNMESQAETKRQSWANRSGAWTEALTQSLKVMDTFLARLDRGGDQQAKQWEQLLASLREGQTSSTQIMRDFSQLMTEAAMTIRQDSQSRTVFTSQFQMQIAEYHARQEQLLQAISLALPKAAS